MKGNVLITGGTRGIGLGIARALAKEGFNLALNGTRSSDQIKALLTELRAFAEVEYFQVDLSGETAVSRLLSQVLDRFDNINVLVNNAGVAPDERGDTLDVSITSFDRVMNINLKAPFFLSQQVAKHMIAQTEQNANFKACVVNIGSISAQMASTNRAEYCISKAGLGMLTKVLALRLASSGIPVFEIRPGVIRTDMTEPVLESYQKMLEKGDYLQNRVGISDEVGEAARALITGKMPYCTGQIIYIDGGLSIPRL